MTEKKPRPVSTPGPHNLEPSRNTNPCVRPVISQADHSLQKNGSLRDQWVEVERKEAPETGPE